MPLRYLSVFLAFTTVTLGVLLVHAQNPQASRSNGASTQGSSLPIPLILQENDGEHRLRRPGGPTGSSSVPEFIIKIDKQNGSAEDFYVGAEIMNPGGMIPFHMHHNSEEVVILEEGGATVTVGDKRAVAGPHSIVFIPRETWVSIANTGNTPIHLYGIFSRQGFENFLRARSVRPGEPLTPLTPEEVRHAADEGHVTPWDTSKGPYPPGVPHPLGNVESVVGPEYQSVARLIRH
jgi:mannose-6-phosphate isomerase-like protein (cupin superfamily)